LDGQVAIVTGAGSGIGRALAQGLVEAGAAAVLAGRNAERLERAAAELGEPGRRVLAVPTDVSDEAAIARLVQATVAEFGRIDVLVNNAGTIRRAPSEEFSREDWEEVLRVNLSAPFFLAQAVARVMIKGGIKGRIINTSSLIAVQGGKNVPAYAASKGGLTQVTKSLANDWARYGIRVNAIGPGWVRTELTEALQNNPDRFREISGRIPLGRWAEPADLAGAVVYLASEASAYVTGQVLFVDGGWLAA
jgi:2-deoxy-D-gluconate 3-dehydrogenase